MKRKPTTPGEILYEEFLVPLELTQRALADHLGCDDKVINRIVNDQINVTSEMAVRLSLAFDTTPDFWLNALMAFDLWKLHTKKPKIPLLIRKRRRRRQQLDGAAQ